MEKQSWEKEWAIKRAIPSNEAFQIDEEIKFIHKLLKQKDREWFKKTSHSPIFKTKHSARQWRRNSPNRSAPLKETLLLLY